MILRIIRPDKLVPGVMIFISDTLGEKFITPPPFDLSIVFKDSTS